MNDADFSFIPSPLDKNLHGRKFCSVIAMQALSDDQRILVMLVLVEGYSYQEAARITGVPIGTVMSRLARGRQVLMKELSGKGDLA